MVRQPQCLFSCIEVLNAREEILRLPQYMQAPSSERRFDRLPTFRRYRSLEDSCLSRNNCCSMHISLDLQSCKWHFKRSARAFDSPWSPQLEPSQKAGHDANPGEYRGSDDPRLDSWIQVETMPNDPFLLLQNAGIIPDPAIGLNEDQVQCTVSTFHEFR